MDKKILCATIVGVILYVLLFYVAYVQKDLSIHQLLLMLITPLIIGVISGKIKRAAILGFVISFVMLTLEPLVLQPAGAADPSRIFATILLIMPFILISVAMAAVGGLIGKRLIKK